MYIHDGWCGDLKALILITHVSYHMTICASQVIIVRHNCLVFASTLVRKVIPNEQVTLEMKKNDC